MCASAGTHAHMLSLYQLSTLSISLELHLHVETTSSGRVEQVSGTHVNNVWGPVTSRSLLKLFITKH